MDLLELFTGPLVEKGKAIIWGWLYDLASSFATEAFNLMTSFILLETDISKFMDVAKYVQMMQYLAGGLVAVAALWEIFKQLSGGMIPTEERGIGEIILKSVWAVFLIFFLPWSVTNLFIKLNNTLVKAIQHFGVKIKPGAGSAFDLLFAPKQVTEVLIIMLLILAIAGLILGVISGIRYVEIIITMIISPIVAVSAINEGQALEVWVRETVAIVFTQALHIFLLQLLMVTIGHFGEFMNYVIAIGIIAIMIRGPQTLRKYVYSAGAGSAGVRAVGSAGRMAALKFVTQSAKPF